MFFLFTRLNPLAKSQKDILIFVQQQAVCLPSPSPPPPNSLHDYSQPVRPTPQIQQHPPETIKSVVPNELRVITAPPASVPVPFSSTPALTPAPSLNPAHEASPRRRAGSSRLLEHLTYPRPRQRLLLQWRLPMWHWWPPRAPAHPSL